MGGESKGGLTLLSGGAIRPALLRLKTVLRLTPNLRATSVALPLNGLGGPKPKPFTRKPSDLVHPRTGAILS